MLPVCLAHYSWNVVVSSLFTASVFHEDFAFASYILESTDFLFFFFFFFYFFFPFCIINHIYVGKTLVCL